MLPDSLLLAASLFIMGIIVGICGLRSTRVSRSTLRLFIQIVCDPKNQPHQFVGKPRELWGGLTGSKATFPFLHLEDYVGLLEPGEIRRRLLAAYERRDRAETRAAKAWERYAQGTKPGSLALAYEDDLIKVEQEIGLLEDKLVAIKTRSV